MALWSLHWGRGRGRAGAGGGGEGGVGEAESQLFVLNGKNVLVNVYQNELLCTITVSTST